MRGDSRCPQFCMSCKSDCRCDKLGCNTCHTCRDNQHFNHEYPYTHYGQGGYGSPSGTVLINGCNAFEHDCTNHMQLSLAYISVEQNMLIFPKLFSCELIKISIGKDEKEVRHVPKTPLAEHSEYFKNTFSFNEKAEKDSAKTPIVLGMDVDRPHAFDKFIQFLYWADYVTPASPKIDDLEFRVHAEVYILAERLQASKLKDLALRKATKVAVEFSRRVTNSVHKAEAVVHLTCLPDIIDMVYLNTLEFSTDDKITAEDSAKGAADTEPAKQKPIDKFRQLVACFSSACLIELKTTEGFLVRLKVFPDFAVDLVTKLPRGKALAIDENGYLKI